MLAVPFSILLFSYLFLFFYSFFFERLSTPFYRPVFNFLNEMVVQLGLIAMLSGDCKRWGAEVSMESALKRSTE